MQIAKNANITSGARGRTRIIARIITQSVCRTQTAVAAHKLQRDFVGFELDKDEYDAGVKRLNAERAQVSIFDIFNF